MPPPTFSNAGKCAPSCVRTYAQYYFLIEKRRKNRLTPSRLYQASPLSQCFTMIALVEAAQSGLFSRKNVLQNACAGIVVGIVSIPLSMAFAIASNVKPEVGLHTAMIAALCL
jgi:hypothetical protein